MSDVRLKITADAAQAEAQFAKLANRQDDMSKSADKANRSFAKQEKLTLDLSAVIGKLAPGAAIFTALGKGVASYSEYVTEALRKTVELENAIVGLSSLGNNINNLPQLREKAMALSTTLNVPIQEATQFLYNFQSGTGKLNEKDRSALMNEIIEARMATGAPLTDVEQIISSTFVGFQDQMGNDPNRVQNMIMHIADQAKTDMGKMGQYLPESFAKGRGLGFSLEEMAGMTVVGSQTAGGFATFSTQLSALMTGLEGPKGKKLGLKGGLMEQLGQLKGMDAAGLMELVGDTGFGLLSDLIAQPEYLKSAIDEATKKSMTGDIAAGLVGTRLSDPAAMTAYLEQSFGLIKEDAYMRGLDETAMKIGLGNSATRAGEKMNLGPMGWMLPSGLIEGLGLNLGFQQTALQTKLSDLGKVGPMGENVAGLVRQLYGVEGGMPEHRTVPMGGPGGLVPGFQFSGPTPSPDFSRLTTENTEALRQNTLALQGGGTNPASGQAVKRDAGVTE